MRRPERGSFEHRIARVTWPTSQLWRLSRFPATEPWFGRSGDGRFDDPAGLSESGAEFGVLYAAQDAETAFCESVLHAGGLFRHGAFEVARSALVERSLVAFRHPTDEQLTFADLTGDALKALGLNNDISAGDDYRMSQQWSKAIHDALPDVAGIRYVSRQRNGCHCFAIFERSGLIADAWAPLTDGDVALLCEHFNVKSVT